MYVIFQFIVYKHYVTQSGGGGGGGDGSSVSTVNWSRDNVNSLLVQGQCQQFTGPVSWSKC